MLLGFFRHDSRKGDLISIIIVVSFSQYVKKKYLKFVKHQCGLSMKRLPMLPP